VTGEIYIPHIRVSPRLRTRYLCKGGPQPLNLARCFVTPCAHGVGSVWCLNGVDRIQAVNNVVRHLPGLKSGFVMSL
jgi:hypothetical protein